jgi:putative transposase
MDDGHLHAALRYVALNPVRAGLVRDAKNWAWSSIHALLDPELGDGLTATAPVFERCPDILERIAEGEDEAMSRMLRRAESVGRPAGSVEFVQQLERKSGRSLVPARRGPKLLPL